MTASARVLLLVLLSLATPRSGAEDELDAARAGLQEARAATENGDVRAARETLAGVREALEDLDPEQDGVDAALAELGTALFRAGELRGAREVLTALVGQREEALDPDDQRLLAARSNLAAVLQSLGDYEAARFEHEALLATCERLFPEDHPGRLATTLNLAITLAELGELHAARRLEERALEVQSQALGARHAATLQTMLQVAATRAELGDLWGARELEERVVATLEEHLPAGHPELLTARHNLAISRAQTGDAPGARAMFEEIVAGLAEELPPDHPHVLGARTSLAQVLQQQGEPDAALVILEELLELRRKTLSAGHPDLVQLRQNRARMLLELDMWEAARAELEEVLELRGEATSEYDRERASARLMLAMALDGMGELDEALEQKLVVLRVRERALPPDHPALLVTRRNVTASLFRLERGEEAVPQAEALAAGALARAARLELAADREARAVSGEAEDFLGMLLAFAELAPSASTLGSDAFAWIETMRHLAGARATTRARVASSPELETLTGRAARTRRALDALVERGPSEGEGDEPFLAELRRRTEERDRAERALRVELAERGGRAAPISVAAVAAALDPGAVAIGYRRYSRRQLDPTTKTFGRADWLLAHRVTPDGELRRVELGPAAELEELVLGWRAQVRGGDGPARGVGVAPEGGDVADAELERLALELVERLVEPVLAGLEDVRELVVCPDDFLHLLPLTALPLDGGLAVRSEVSFARLVDPPPACDTEPRLLVLGGIDYDAEVVPAGAPPFAPPPQAGVADEAPFAPLPGSEREARAIARLFERTFESEPGLELGAAASKARLVAGAPRVRFVHLATHGWFAGAGVMKGDAVAELAPLTFCGLALAGANHPADRLGRRAGVLTAEELAGLDLSACELAVLSGCETGLGLHSSGQGVRSLQTALLSAGARSVLASSWPVSDEATSDLMQRFYSGMWEAGLSPTAALRAAQESLRAGGSPPRDWAGWVLIGAPR